VRPWGGKGGKHSTEKDGIERRADKGQVGEEERRIDDRFREGWGWAGDGGLGRRSRERL